MKSKLPSRTLTFIICDPAPVVHLNAEATYRTVRVKLTDDQLSLLSLHEHSLGDGEFISRVVSEPGETIL